MVLTTGDQGHYAKANFLEKVSLSVKELKLMIFKLEY